MARGPSGRFVIVLEPKIKNDLYSALSADGLDLKEWFQQQINTYLAERSQPNLPGIFAPEKTTTKKRSAAS